MSNNLKVIVLAAGKGTRMKSDLPKVLHPLGNRPMVEYVLDCAERLQASETILVINPEMKEDIKTLETRDNTSVVIQEKQLGTGDAVLSAKDHFENFDGVILVLFGDTPNISVETITPLIEQLNSSPTTAVGILGMFPEEKTGYARIDLKDNGHVKAIIEQKDATDEELELDFCNSGVMALKAHYALDILNSIGSDNAAKEFYLTDAVKIANNKKLDVVVTEGGEQELAGINSKSHLAEAENFIQNQWRSFFLEQGVTMIDPNTVYFSNDTEISVGCVIEPNVVFGPGVTLEEGVTIKAFSYLTETHVMQGGSVGPFAHLRPGTKLHKGARVGNFVEVKNSVLKEGVKANHLSYIGDCDIGANSNIGAGTITCNYDGFTKSKTTLGENVFIGSNSSLVAPVNIGSNAIVGAGSVITKDVPAEALAVARGDQKTLEKGGAKFRKKRQSKKSA